MFRKSVSLILAVIIAASCMLGCAVCEKPFYELSGKDRIRKLNNNYAALAGEFLEQLANNHHYRSTVLQRKHAREYIISELKNAGYTDDQIGVEWGVLTARNVVLTVEGKNKDKQIIVGAHYDGTGDGDNLSGTALVLANAVGLAGKKLPVTVKFIFFDLEEIGLLGSASYEKLMSREEKESTLFMVNIDSVAFGDYCNVYGGVSEDETGRVIAGTEGYEFAMKAARKLGFNTYGTKYLDGYFAKHGRGPKLDSKGLFTNPWTADNPPPVDTTVPYSPTIDESVSDHYPFSSDGITYIYFEASNWFADGGKISGKSYSGYYETTDTSIGDNGMFMNTKYDTIENLEKYFPGRAMEHFNIFSPLLSYIILHPEGVK